MVERQREREREIVRLCVIEIDIASLVCGESMRALLPAIA